MSRSTLIVSFGLSLIIAAAAIAQETPPDAPKQAPSGETAKPKKAPPPKNPNRGPWDNDLLISESIDGITFAKPTVFVERGGVPSIVRDSGGKLIAAFQWFPM